MNSAALSIQPIDIPFNEVLHKHSVEYWKVSRVWNGRSSEGISMGEAFDRLNKVLNECNPQRPLANRIAHLKYEMVEHGSKPKVKRAAANANKPILVL